MEVQLAFPFLQKVCRDNSAAPPHIIEPCVKFVQLAPEVVVYKPRLMLWDPQKQFPHIHLHCPFHKLPLESTVSWTNTKRKPPRKLYHSAGLIHLVSRMYECPEKHEIVSSDEGILTQIPQGEIPFLLSHRGGMTSDLRKYITQRIMAGCTFHSLAQFLATRSLWLMKEYQESSISRTVQVLPMKAITDGLGDLSPSQEYLTRIFLRDYKLTSTHYKEHFKQVPGNILSCDHTFKVSVNIGYENDNRKWIKLYDSLFIVLNELGQVMCYKLVSKRSFENAKDCFSSIQENGHIPTLIAVDNCCQWRKKLQEVFPHARVILDLFHAVQRITRTLSRKHPLHAQFTLELRQVFRQTGDNSKERTQATPSVEQMISEFDSFISKWKNLALDDIPIVTQETIKAFDNLREHILKGCLSDIPKGVGTNKNERLHGLLNRSAVAVSRIAPELANALLTTIFYRWNELKASGKILPITSRELGNMDNSEENSDQPEQATTSSPVTEKSSQTDQETKEIHNKAHAIVDMQKKIQEQVGKLQVPIEEILAPIEHEQDLLLTSFHEGEVQEVMHRYSLSLDSTSWLHQLIQDVRETQGSNGLEAESYQQIIALCRDVAANPLQIQATDIHKFFKLAVTCTQAALGFIIPGAVNKYVTFWPEGGISTVRVYTLVLKQGQSNTVQMLSASPQSSVVVSTTEQSNHVVCEEDSILTKHEGCRCGKGAKRNKSNLSTSCVNQAGSYKSKCPCLRAGVKCGKQCSCLRCDNPHGKRSIFSIDHSTMKEKHQKKLSSKRQPLGRQRAKQWLEDAKCEHKNPWTDLDTAALYVMLSIVKQHQRSTSSASNHASVIKMYASTQEACLSCECIQPVTTKEKLQIQKKAEHLKKKLKILQCVNLY